MAIAMEIAVAERVANERDEARRYLVGYAVRSNRVENGDAPEPLTKPMPTMIVL